MSTLVFTHPDCLAHDTGPGHPERPARLAAVLRGLEGIGDPRLAFVEAPLAAEADLAAVHAPEAVARVLGAIPAGDGYGFVDHETVVSPGSRAAALRAAGAALAAVDAVMAGAARNAFCAVRPPGHHAMRARSMGFCLFNNAALAAFHARDRHGLARVAVLDFDVHHGNGTEDICRGAAGLFYGSTHEYPNYPGTGTSSAAGPCPVVNVPLAPGASGAAFRAAWAGTVLPALDAFRPELVVVSAGFDGHRKDPLSAMELETADFAWLTAELCAAAARHAQGRLVSLLEGGYDLDVLAAAARAHVAALLEG